MDYIIYCDESSSQGERYTDFFGGCLVDGRYINQIVRELNSKKQDLNLKNEIKWVRVTENYLEKYIGMMELFFSYVKDGKIKVRIMFRKKEDTNNSVNRSEDKYFLLYYQFLKHAFGLKYIPVTDEANIRIYLDKLPDKMEKCEVFKKYVFDMQKTKFFANSGIIIKRENIVEINSAEHVIQQCVDIILGAMYFRLNKLNEIVPKGERFRGKRTKAKERLYNIIRKHIDEMLPNFNIGVSTGARSIKDPHWNSPYEHWLFTSSDIAKLENNPESDTAY